MIPQLNKYTLDFPNPNLATKDGIVAWGGDLNPTRVLKAYQEGIFPWNTEDEPLLWWSPTPRLIMDLENFKLHRSLKKKLKHFDYKFDTQFKEVMNQCGTIKRKDQDGSWITHQLIETFEILHGMGIAHSVESYQNNKLVGGLYGIVIGKVFCGESMFAQVSDASKAAYAILVEHLKIWGYDFIDCQIPTKHLKSLGAKEVTRELFLQRLYKSRFETVDHRWEIDKNII
jgi:leucyl/phenylalanyl-tRNA--protein transferase